MKSLPNKELKECTVGIDTSNYTTSVAVATADGEVVANLKAPLPVRKGECGLRQSDAVFAHVKNLPALMRQLSEVLENYKVLAVGVSATPRDAEGSYMPCFLSGIAAGEAFSAASGAPLYRFSHQNGHLMAALYSAGARHLEGKPFLAFHVSGGTTEMLLVEPKGTAFSVTEIGGTRDLNAGQAVDRVGVMLGLSFPCGPALERLAEENTKKIPKPRVAATEGFCHFSGLENLAKRLFDETGDRALCAAFVLQYITEALAHMTAFARMTYGSLPVLFAGGVMSNRIISEEIKRRFDDVYFAAPAFSADNAAGTALLTLAAWQGEKE